MANGLQWKCVLLKDHEQIKPFRFKHNPMEMVLLFLDSVISPRAPQLHAPLTFHKLAHILWWLAPPNLSCPQPLLLPPSIWCDNLPYLKFPMTKLRGVIAPILISLLHFFLSFYLLSYLSKPFFLLWEKYN